MTISYQIIMFNLQCFPPARASRSSHPTVSAAAAGTAFPSFPSWPCARRWRSQVSALLAVQARKWPVRPWSNCLGTQFVRPWTAGFFCVIFGGWWRCFLWLTASNGTSNYRYVIMVIIMQKWASTSNRDVVWCIVWYIYIYVYIYICLCYVRGCTYTDLSIFGRLMYVYICISICHVHLYS